MTQPDLAGLVHLAGFATGIVLYAMLVVMTVRHRTSGGGAPATQRSPLAAGALGLLWNAGGLVIYGLQDFGLAVPSPFLVALSFAALGFLPAVVVQSAVGGGSLRVGATRGALAAVAYALSCAAALLHFIGAVNDSVPSRPALLTLTIGYMGLVVMLAVVVRGRPGWQRNLSAAALAAFAVSALHLGHDASQSDNWLVALLGHHASLPLVLVVLYQDYRFAFADLFLRRALSLVALVAIAVTLHVLFATPLMHTIASGNDENLFATAAHVALWVGTALLYPAIRNMVGTFVDRVILDRVDYRYVRDDVNFAISRAATPNDILARACAILVPVLGAKGLGWRVAPAASPSPRTTVATADTRDRAVVHIPTSDQPHYEIDIDGLVAGRRLLSDDIALLESVASACGRRIDALRVTQERFARDLREREMMQFAAESELRALRAQLNPHFLFNALTTVGYLLRAAPERALATLYRLTDLLRAVLRPSSGEFVTLGEELEIVEAYLAIERERFEDRLLVRVDVPEELRAARIPPLLLQPLVENSVKHGISGLKHGGSIVVSASVERHNGNDKTVLSTLRLTISDTGAGFDSQAQSHRGDGGGVGLSSVRRRLERHFGSAASFELVGAREQGTTVTLGLPLAYVSRDPH